MGCSRVRRVFTGGVALGAVTLMVLACAPPPSGHPTTTTTTTTVLPPPPDGLVINEIDYDQPGTDSAEFVELENTSAVSVDLSGVVLYLVNGANGAVYRSVDLGVVGTLPAGQFLVVGDTSVVTALPAGTPAIEMTGVDNIQNGAPDAAVLIDTNRSRYVDATSYEGSVLNAAIPGFVGTVILDEGYPHAVDPLGPADSNTFAGSLARIPDGQDTEDERADWHFTMTPTPGAANPL